MEILPQVGKKQGQSFFVKKMVLLTALIVA